MPTPSFREIVRVEAGNILLAVLVVALLFTHAPDLWIGGTLGALLRGIESRRYPYTKPKPPEPAP